MSGRVKKNFSVKNSFVSKEIKVKKNLSKRNNESEKEKNLAQKILGKKNANS